MENDVQVKQDGERSEHQLQVDRFMRLAKQELPPHPTIPSLEVRKLRAKLLLEEALETVEALGLAVHTTDEADLRGGPLSIAGIFVVEEGTPNIVEVVDGCCDLKVVTTGTLSAFGVSDVNPQRLVDDNNLAKFGPGHSIRPDGRLIKPAGHKPPALLAELQRQYDLFFQQQKQAKLL